MQEGNQLGCQDDGESNEGESRRAVVISGMSCRLAVTSESDASFSLSFSSEGKQGNRAATSWCRLRCEAPLKRRERMLQIKGSSRALTFPFLSLTRARLSLTITILFLSLSLALSPADQLCSGNHPLSLEDLHFKNSFAGIITNRLS